MGNGISIVFFPKMLGKDDKLTDGPNNTSFSITEDTLLIWIDFMPTDRFTHLTHYLLVSKSDVSSHVGAWWPVLNGKRIILGNGTINLSFPEKSDLKQEFIPYPYFSLLSKNDVLQDGKGGQTIKISEDNTALIWVDHDPYAKFAHKVSYIIIYPSKKVVLCSGSWEPVLNNQKLVFKNTDTFKIIKEIGL